MSIIYRDFKIYHAPSSTTRSSKQNNFSFKTKEIFAYMCDTYQFLRMWCSLWKCAFVHSKCSYFIYVIRLYRHFAKTKQWLQREIDTNEIDYDHLLILLLSLILSNLRPLTHGNVFLCFCIVYSKQFIVLKGIENNQRITWNNTKMQENVSVCTGSEFQALVRVHSSKFKLNRLSLYRPDLVVICKVAHIQRCIHIPRLRIIFKSYRFTSDIDFPLFRQLSCKNQPGRCILYVVRRSHGRRSSAWTSKTLGALECDHISIWRASA